MRYCIHQRAYGCYNAFIRNTKKQFIKGGYFYEEKKVLTVLLTGAMVASMAAGATVVSAEESDNTLTVWAWDQNFNIKSMQIAADQYAADHEDSQ